MKKLCLLTWALAYYAYAGSAMPEAVIEQYYPGKTAGYPSITAQDGMTYCMDSVVQHPISSTARQLYILATGYPCDVQTGEAIVSHSSAGNVGVFVLTQSQGGKWHVSAAEPLISSGSWGEPNRDWALTLFNPQQQIYGFVGSEGGSGAGGEMVEVQVILLPFKGKIIRSLIPTYHSYEGGSTVLETAAVEVLAQPDENGFYPLKVTFMSQKGPGVFDNDDAGLSEDGKRVLHATSQSQGSEIVKLDSYSGCYEPKMSPIMSEDIHCSEEY